MSVNQLPISIFYIKKDGKLEPLSKLDIIRESTFIKSLKEGDKVEVTYQVEVDDGSYGQLSKVHACIRQLALDTGSEFGTMKIEIKKRAGLIDTNSEDGYKSFAKCSKEELSMAIRIAIQIGDLVNCNLHSF